MIIIAEVKFKEMPKHPAKNEAIRDRKEKLESYLQPENGAEL